MNVPAGLNCLSAGIYDTTIANFSYFQETLLLVTSQVFYEQSDVHFTWKETMLILRSVEMNAACKISKL